MITTRTDLSTFQGIVVLVVVASNSQPMTVAKQNFDDVDAEVVIIVSDKKPPKFDQKEYKVTIREDAKTGDYISLFYEGLLKVGRTKVAESEWETDVDSGT